MISSLVPLFNRTSFVSRTDVYARGVSDGPAGNITHALEGVAPFDAVGNVISENYRDVAMQRLARYRQNWKFYTGDHFANPFDDGERKAVFNFCRKIVDKAVDWFVSSGFTIRSSAGNEQVAELVNSVWEENNQMALQHKAGQFGAVTGDCFYYVTVKSTDEAGGTLPKSEWKVRIDVLDPAYCFPVWSPGSPNEMSAAYVQFPVMMDGTLQLYTLYITPNSFTTYMGGKAISKQINPFGRVNLVHVPNLPEANSVFGVSDLDNVIPLNIEYNTVSHSIRRTIRYQAEPVTLIYGIRASNLERGANKVWSNLPVEAKVENLELKSDLKLCYEYLKTLLDNICMLSDTPRLALDSTDLQVSNTSGVAMQMLFQPLMEKTQRRQAQYQKGMRGVNELILLAHTRLIGVTIEDLADDPSTVYHTEVEFNSPLPKDEGAELDIALKKLEKKIWSRAEVIRQVGKVADIERLSLELIADEQHDLAILAETQKANMGGQPDLSAAFLGSIPLSEDLEGIALQVAEIEQQVKESEEQKQQEAVDAQMKAASVSGKPVKNSPATQDRA